MSVRIGKYTVGKECGGRWFPGIGYGYWDGLHYFLFRQKPKVNLKFRTLTNRQNGKKDGFAIGPLIVRKAK
jgi:hypothetical protein